LRGSVEMGRKRLISRGRAAGALHAAGQLEDGRGRVRRDARRRMRAVGRRVMERERVGDGRERERSE
jgi:hypothetical protein